MTSTKGLSQTELDLLTMRQAGLDPVDWHGRLVGGVVLGSGPQSQLVRGIYPIQEKRTPYESRVLSPKDFERLYKGVAVANLGGLVLNTFITISWELAGLRGPSAVHAAQEGYQQCLNKWFRYRRERDRDFPPCAGVWVKEVGRTLGLHTHYLIHVPERYWPEFQKWMRDTIAERTDSPVAPVGATAKGKPLYVTDTRYLLPSWDTDQQWRVFRYMTKGLDPKALIKELPPFRRRMLAHEYYGLQEISDQGLVIGKRCGRLKPVSEAAFARWRADYKEVMKSARLSAGPGSYDYGNSFVVRGNIRGLEI